MRVSERIALGQRCARCPYATEMMAKVLETGEYEPSDGKTECREREVRRKVRVCKVAFLRCAELIQCPKDGLSEEEIERLVDEFGEYGQD